MNYRCEIGDYLTHRHYDYKKHNLTQKHLEKSKDAVKTPRNPQ